MNLTMSYEHRILDGVQASSFLSSVQSGLENWTRMRYGSGACVSVGKLINGFRRAALIVLESRAGRPSR